MASAVPYDPEANPFASETSSPVVQSNPEFSEDPHPEGEDEGRVLSPPSDSRHEEEEEEDDDEDKPIGHTVHNNNSNQGEAGPPGSSGKPKKYKLVTKVTSLERHGKKDPIIRFDAYTTLPRFRTTTFRDIRRTYNEFVKFFDHMNGNNPECFVPSLPMAVSSAGAGTEEDEVKLKSRMQKWLDRVSSNPILARDEEFIHFVEGDFGYTPVANKRPPATGLTRKAMKQLQPPPDEVEELRDFRPLVKSTYLACTDIHAKLEKVTKHRRSLGLSLTDFGHKVGNVANLEDHNGMINMWRKLGKVFMSLGDLEAVKATSEAASLGDGVSQVANDGYVAKEALTNRHLLMRELAKAQATTKARHQTATRVKGSNNISPLKVDEAIAALEDATKSEEQLTNKVRRVSDNMLLEKSNLLNHFETDIKNAVAEYVVRAIDSERRALSTWEAIRVDVRAVDANGGLSRLGREATPSSRRSAIAQSQGMSGDSWSGDRGTKRANAHDPFYFDAPSSNREEEGDERRENNDGDDDDDDDFEDDSQQTTMDARNAASLLAGSTF